MILHIWHMTLWSAWRGACKFYVQCYATSTKPFEWLALNISRPNINDLALYFKGCLANYDIPVVQGCQNMTDLSVWGHTLKTRCWSIKPLLMRAFPTGVFISTFHTTHKLRYFLVQNGIMWSWKTRVHIKCMIFDQKHHKHIWVSEMRGCVKRNLFPFRSRYIFGCDFQDWTNIECISYG